MYYIFGEPVDTFLGHYINKSKIIEVDDKLRGWSDSEEIMPLAEMQLPIYVVAGKYCPTARDVYLQYVLKKKPAITAPLLSGRFIHEIMSRVITTAKEYIYSHGVDSDFDILRHMIEQCDKVIEETFTKSKWEVKYIFSSEEFEKIRRDVKKVWMFQSIQIAASVELVLSKFKYIEKDALVGKSIPMSVEQKLDGSRIGLSKQLSFDALHVPNTIIMDVKTGKPHDFHLLSVAGYGLAYENEYKQPVNLGCIIYPQFLEEKSVPYIEKRPVMLDESLRREFIAERNKKIGIVLLKKDPGISNECPTSCGFYDICHPKK